VQERIKGSKETHVPPHKTKKSNLLWIRRRGGGSLNPAKGGDLTQKEGGEGRPWKGGGNNGPPKRNCSFGGGVEHSSKRLREEEQVLVLGPGEKTSSIARGERNKVADCCPNEVVGKGGALRG